MRWHESHDGHSQVILVGCHPVQVRTNRFSWSCLDLRGCDALSMETGELEFDRGCSEEELRVQATFRLVLMSGWVPVRP